VDHIERVERRTATENVVRHGKQQFPVHQESVVKIKKLGMGLKRKAK
jgi:hypothetical protein